MSKSVAVAFIAILMLLCSAGGSIAQEAPSEPSSKPEKTVKSYEKYDDLFDEFSKRREVFHTKLDRLRRKEGVKPEVFKKIIESLVALDAEYIDALTKYIKDHAKARDLMFARFELAVALSKLPDRLEEAVAVAEELIREHPDAELVEDARFVRARSLFWLHGREKDALKALDDFIERHSSSPSADLCVRMRMRTLLFLDRVEDLTKVLTKLLKTRRVKKDKAAKESLQRELDNLDWIGRKVPKFALKDMDGKQLRNADFEEKPWLIFIWDSNSGACLRELPFVEELRKTYGEKLKVLGININESRPAFEQWLKRFGDKVGFRNAWIDRDVESTLIRKLDLRLIPFSVLVGADGKIYRYDVHSDDLLRYAKIMLKEN